MKANKKILMVSVVAVVLSVGIVYAIYSKNEKSEISNVKNNEYDLVTGEKIDTRTATNDVSKLTMASSDNAVLAGTDWFDQENSPLVFVDGEHWVWYASKDMDSANAISGTYEAFYGKDAYDVLDASYFESEDVRPQGDDYSLTLKLHVLSLQENGEDTLVESSTQTFMGSLSGELLSLMDMNNLLQYTFSAEQNPDIEAADLVMKEILKDVTYNEDMNAWKTFEIKVNGINVSYPYSSTALKEAGLRYGDVDENTGMTKFKDADGINVLTGIFLNKKSDALSYIDIEASGSVSVTLANGITWGASETDVVKAFGEANEVVRGSLNEKVYRYNDGDMQMELYVHGEDSMQGSELGLTRISIHNFKNEG